MSNEMTIKQLKKQTMEDPLDKELKAIDRDYRNKVAIACVLTFFGMLWGIGNILSALY